LRSCYFVSPPVLTQDSQDSERIAAHHIFTTGSDSVHKPAIIEPGKIELSDLLSFSVLVGPSQLFQIDVGG
jgi:hypothetical protein